MVIHVIYFIANNMDKVCPDELLGLEEDTYDDDESQSIN